MKYIDAEKLLAEIQRRKKQDTTIRERSILIDIETAIDFLQRSSLQIPNLDEAAKDSWAEYEYRESPRGLYSTCYVDGFKAGAEWMAGQEQSEQIEEYGPYARQYPKSKVSQEQPKGDLEKEIVKTLKKFNMLAIGKKDFTDIARRFYELGKNTKKEK